MGNKCCKSSKTENDLSIEIPDEKFSREGPLSEDCVISEEDDRIYRNAVRETQVYHEHMMTERGKPRSDIKEFLFSSLRENRIYPKKNVQNMLDQAGDNNFPKESSSHNMEKVNEDRKETQIFSLRQNTFQKNFSSDSASSVGSIALDAAIVIVENKKSVFKEYQIIDIIGKGAFGEVKKAIHNITGKIYALKIINRDLCRRSVNLEEIDILKRLSHPNIVRLHEFYHDYKNYYLITEYCAGGELLDKIIRMKSLSEPIAAKIMRQLLSAVVYCHSKKIVHRDLKPENLVLEKDDLESNLKVIDFGTSKVFKSVEKMREIMGTPYYIAPEVLKGRYDEKCDVWSCGVILYIILSGTPPFTGNSNDEILANVKKGRLSFSNPIWKKVSVDAINFIRSLIEPNPAKRLKADEAVNHIWILKFSQMGSIRTENLIESMNMLKTFRAQSNMQKAILAYMATHLLTTEQEKKARDIFEMLDINHDGQLSRDELLEGYKVMYNGDVELATREVDATMGRIDINKDGTIDYNEYLIATLEQAETINKENLKRAFDFFDTDGNGEITKDEMKRIFSFTKGDKVIRRIMRESDANGDGQINFEEFTELMKKFAQNTMVLGQAISFSSILEQFANGIFSS